MMVVLRAFALIAIGLGAGALHHTIGKPITWDIGENPPWVEDAPPAPDGDEPEIDGPEVDGPEVPDDGEPAVDPTPIDVQAPTLTYGQLKEQVDVNGAWLLFTMAENGNAAIIDARAPDEFAAGHIPGAFNITPSSFRAGIPEETSYIDLAAPILIYCQGGDCHDSRSVGQSLRAMGFQRLHEFTAGYPAWVDAGYPTEVGP